MRRDLIRLAGAACLGHRPGRRVRDVPDLGAGPDRRGAPGRRHRRHGRGAVRRPAVAGVRRPARPRGRALPRRCRATPRGDRRQGRRRPNDRGRGRPGLRDRARRPARGHPGGGPEPDDARIDPRGRRPARRANGARSAVFVSDRPHMLRVLRMAADDGITAWGSPTATSPIERDFAGQVDATVHELGALAYYFLTGASRSSTPTARPRRRPARNRGRREPDFPLGDGGLAPYTVPKPAVLGHPSPRHRPRPSPVHRCPAQREGVREAGRGSIVRRSDRLRA